MNSLSESTLEALLGEELEALLSDCSCELVVWLELDDSSEEFESEEPGVSLNVTLETERVAVVAVSVFAIVKVKDETGPEIGEGKVYAWRVLFVEIPSRCCPPSTVRVNGADTPEESVDQAAQVTDIWAMLTGSLKVTT